MGGGALGQKCRSESLVLLRVQRQVQGVNKSQEGVSHIFEYLGRVFK